MHVAATNPLALDASGVDADVLAREKAILMDKNVGKPANVMEKIVESGLKSYLKEVTLLDQPFVIDPSKTVGQAAKELEGKAGAPVTIKGFIRYALGEGIEKKQDDFAAEVAAAGSRSDSAARPTRQRPKRQRPKRKAMAINPKRFLVKVSGEALMGGFAFMAGVCSIGGYIIVSSMVADIVEDVQAQTGDRAEGLLMTADSLPNRIVNSLSVALPGLLLAWVGFPEKARPGPEAMAMMTQVGWVFLPLMATISCLSIGTW
eukprot:gene53323-71285_t